MRIECADYTRENWKAVLGLIDEASSWLRNKDTDQWARPWPNKWRRNGRVRKGLKNGKTWIVWHGQIPVATITIAEQPNVKVWPASGDGPQAPAVYVHRLITARNYGGWGLGEQLIDWAGLRGRELSGAESIRIDVWTTNTALHEYYTKRGFEPCGMCPDPKYPSGALFQKPVSKIDERSIRIPQFPGLAAEFSMVSLPPSDLADFNQESLAEPAVA